MLRNLFVTGIYIDGARAAIRQMLEIGAIKADKYLQAEMQLILSSKQNTERWLIDNDPIYFINHKRDKKNKLISVEATFDKPKNNQLSEAGAVV